MSDSFRDLVVWKKSVLLALDVYRATERFPERERYGLTSQLRKAVVSVSSNIAEGKGRLTDGEFRQFLGHARGSLFELETQIEIATQLGLLENRRDLIDRVHDVSRGLWSLIKYLKK